MERNWNEVVVKVIIVILLLAISFTNFLLFHALAEFVSATIALLVFIVSYHSKKYIDHPVMNTLGIPMLFIAVIDVLHLLTY